MITSAAAQAARAIARAVAIKNFRYQLEKASFVVDLDGYAVQINYKSP